MLIKTNSLLQEKCIGKTLMYAKTGRKLRLIGDPLSHVKTILATLWEMPTEYWRSSWQWLESSEGTVGNTRMKDKVCRAHFPPCLQMISLAALKWEIQVKKLPANRKQGDPSNLIAHHVSTYIRLFLSNSSKHHRFKNFFKNLRSSRK